MVPEQLANNGWTADKWEHLESHARDVVNRYARLRQAIPRGPDMPGAYVVPMIRAASAEPLSLEITTAAPPNSAEAKFNLLPEQAADADLAARLVDRAARVLASREDAKLFELLTAAPIDSIQGEDAATLVAMGVNGLRLAASPYAGPFCLLARPALWSAIAVPTQPHPRGLIPAIETLLGDGSRIIDVPSPADDAPSLLFAMDPFALELVTVEPPTISMIGLVGGVLSLRLHERFYLRIVDGQARRSLALAAKK